MADPFVDRKERWNTRTRLGHTWTHPLNVFVQADENWRVIEREIDGHERNVDIDNTSSAMVRRLLPRRAVGLECPQTVNYRAT